MSRYTNSRHDLGLADRRADEDAVQAMYEEVPYPGLGADLKNLEPMFRPVAAELEAKPNARSLDLGCGTGHILVGVSKRRPTWQCHGIDLSRPRWRLRNNWPTCTAPP